jgi:hypothetical protein
MEVISDSPIHWKFKLWKCWKHFATGVRKALKEVMVEGVYGV